MKTVSKIITLASLSVVFFLSSILTARADELFSKANNYYQARDYEQALRIYLQVIKTGEPSAELYYNTGNCYFKMGSLGKSVLYFERAARLKPDDDDILYNLKIANLKAVDKIETVPPIIYKRWIKSLSESLTISQWSLTFIVLVWLVFVAWALFLFANQVGTRKLTFIIACAVSGLCVVSYLFLEENHRVHTLQKYGVVMAASSYVKSAPDERGTDQFILHEGTKVEVLDELTGWEKIRIANGSVGWLKVGDVEEI